MRSFLLILVLYTVATVASTAYSYEEFAYLQEESIPPLALSDDELAVTPPPPVKKEPETDIFTGIGDWLEARFEKKNEIIPPAYPQIVLQQSLPRNYTLLPGLEDSQW